MGISRQMSEKFSGRLERLWDEMDKVIIGRRRELKLILTALLSQGHVLLEDVPGTGKTTMVKAFAKGLDCVFSRIQCTSDLLPADVLGGFVYNPKTQEFQLRKGPVFTNVLLVDEINRTLPRTQSSLLECMEERQVSIEGRTYPLSKPFIVLATQNPIEMEGTFVLPEAQLDRFLMRLKLGYPTLQEEEQMLARVGDEIPYEKIESTFHPDEVGEMQRLCQDVRVHPDIIRYITALADATRSHEQVAIGVSPRASKALYRTAKAWALLKGRPYVVPDDVKAMVGPVWNHRLILKTEACIDHVQAETVLEEILRRVALPEEEVLKP